MGVRQETGRRLDHADRGRGAASRGWLLVPPTFAGTAVALLFWWWSLDPSLLPRSWSAQGVVSGLSAAIGYLLGTLAGYVLEAVLRRLGRTPARRARRRAWLALGVAGAVVVVAGLALWPGWQNQQRDLVDMEHLSPAVLAPMAAVTLVLFGLLLLAGRLVGHGIALLDRVLSRRLPRLLAHAVTAAVFVVAAVLITRDVAVDGFLGWANRSFGQVDTTTAPSVVAPATPTASGSPASLVPWATLGEYGRSFVAGATTPAELRAFHGSSAPVVQPIRVYAGLRSAGSADERAALAVRELERTGAFQREVLGVVTTTGTGWVDPNAASALEYLHRGDTALVGLQYSYLPSWISFLVDREEVAAAGTALYRHVHRRWSQLPDAGRPRLVIFGESLGSYGAEAAFRGGDAATSLANLVAGSDGALFTGPTASNHIWDQFTDDREPGSPVWRPVYDGGTKVRFANRPADLERPDERWRHPRVLYVHHPSDPVGNATLEALWERPEWTDRPQGYDVPARAGWYPIVTGLQEVADLIAGFSAPSGYGHDYGVDFPTGWAAVVPPAKWTAADTARLQRHLQRE
ncbi:MAG TPA: alpha/beta-hydrolase family protein [Actinomycetes bacterium]|nr:alpha/beta-hydrolase family protein [Actinomycetes bacterium]